MPILTIYNIFNLQIVYLTVDRDSETNLIGFDKSFEASLLEKASGAHENILMKMVSL